MGSARLSALPGNRRDPSVQRPTTASQHGPGTGTRIRDANTSAFPRADFETREPYLVVTLDEACRRQQVGEGWFQTIEQVPTRAISMSVQQILASRRLLCVVPDERKAKAVRAAVAGPVTPEVPASILQTHPAVTLYLDRGSASLLGPA